MGKIIYLMGKSSTGKDTIFKHLMDEGKFQLHRIIPYTTRPIRITEKEGVEYHFTNEEGFHNLLEQGHVIEHREYNTCHGLWRYFTVEDEQINLIKDDYICIGTLESYEKTKQYFGSKYMVPVLIELEDGIRLQRALDREKEQENPKYEEMCRRFLADSEDFSEEKIQKADITIRFQNNDLQQCLKQINTYINKAINTKL